MEPAASDPSPPDNIPRLPISPPRDLSPPVSSTIPRAAGSTHDNPKHADAVVLPKETMGAMGEQFLQMIMNKEAELLKAIAGHEATNKGLFERIEGHDRQLAAQKGVSTRYKTRITELEGIIQSLQSQVADLVATRDDLQEANSRLDRERTLSNDRFTQMENAMAELKEEHQVSRSPCVDHMSPPLANLAKQQLDQTTSIFNEITEQKRRISLELNQLATTVSQQTETIKAREATIADLKSSTEAERTQHQQRVEQLCAEIDTGKKHISGLETQVQELHRSDKILREANRKWKYRHDYMKNAPPTPNEEQHLESTQVAVPGTPTSHKAISPMRSPPHDPRANGHSMTSTMTGSTMQDTHSPRRLDSSGQSPGELPAASMSAPPLPMVGTPKRPRQFSPSRSEHRKRRAYDRFRRRSDNDKFERNAGNFYRDDHYRR